MLPVFFKLFRALHAAVLREIALFDGNPSSFFVGESWTFKSKQPCMIGTEGVNLQVMQAKRALPGMQTLQTWVGSDPRAHLARGRNQASQPQTPSLQIQAPLLPWIWQHLAQQWMQWCIALPSNDLPPSPHDNFMPLNFGLCLATPICKCFEGHQ